MVRGVLRPRTQSWNGGGGASWAHPFPSCFRRAKVRVTLVPKSILPVCTVSIERDKEGRQSPRLSEIIFSLSNGFYSSQSLIRECQKKKKIREEKNPVCLEIPLISPQTFHFLKSIPFSPPMSRLEMKRFFPETDDRREARVTINNPGARATTPALFKMKNYLFPP